MRTLQLLRLFALLGATLCMVAGPLHSRALAVDGLCPEVYPQEVDTSVDVPLGTTKYVESPGTLYCGGGLYGVEVFSPAGPNNRLSIQFGVVHGSSWPTTQQQCESWTWTADLWNADYPEFGGSFFSVHGTWDGSSCTAGINYTVPAGHYYFWFGLHQENGENLPTGPTIFWVYRR